MAFVIERPTLLVPSARRILGNVPPDLLILVGGTGGTTHWTWALPGSPFRRAVLDPYQVPVLGHFTWWSGAWFFPRDDWKQGGEQELAPALRAIAPGTRIHILSHSHGLSVAAWGIAAAGVPITTWTSVAGPVRKELADTYAAAIRHVDRFVQIQDDRADWTQFGGQWFGRLALRRDFPGEPPQVTIRHLPGIGHSGLLHDPPQFPRWTADHLETWATPLPDAAA